MTEQPTKVSDFVPFVYTSYDAIPSYGDSMCKLLVMESKENLTMEKLTYCEAAERLCQCERGLSHAIPAREERLNLKPARLDVATNSQL